MCRENRFFKAMAILILAGFFSAFAEEKPRCSGLDSFRIKECGASGIAECLRKFPECRIARHLNRFAFWIDSIQSDKPCSSRVAAIAERYAGFNDTVRHTFDLNDVAFIGSSDAPVTLLLFVSTSCPLCKKVYKELYGEVTKGKLLNKAKTGIKVFSARPGDLALLAARKFNKQSEFLLSLAGVEERISVKIIMQKVREIGLPDTAFKRLMQDSAVIKTAQASEREGSENGVTVTPTAFINNKRYHSYKDPQWIVDAALYEYDLLSDRKNAGSR